MELCSPDSSPALKATSEPEQRRTPSPEAPPHVPAAQHAALEAQPAHQHGRSQQGEQAAAGRMEPLAAAAEFVERRGADITIATRSAFEAVNSVFHGALLRDAPWPPAAGGNEGAIPHRGARVASDLTVKLAGRRRSQRMSMAPEPTVTIGTQAAFDVLNDMFRGGLPHEDAGCAAQQTELEEPSGGNTGQEGVSAEGAFGTAAAGADLDFPVYEDTQFFGKAQPGGDPSGELAIYEDTQFAAPAHARSFQPLTVHEDTGSARHSSPTGSLQLYEDTQFITGNVTRAASVAVQPAANDITQQMAENVAPAVPHAHQLDVYEETEYRTLASTEPNGAAELSIYEDTALLQTGTGRAAAVMRNAAAEVAVDADLHISAAREQSTGDLLADTDEFADQVGAILLSSSHA